MLHGPFQQILVSAALNSCTTRAKKDVQHKFCNTREHTWTLGFEGHATLGRCPSTVRPVFPVLVFQLSKQQNRTRTTSSTVLGTPPNRTRTKKLPLKDLRGRLLSSLRSQLGIHPNLGLSPLGTVSETVLGHLLKLHKIARKFLPATPAMMTALETCLACPFTRSIASKRLPSKRWRKCNGLSTSAN